MTDITIFYLEMTSREAHQQAPLKAELQVNEAQIKQAKVNRFLYDLIGESWQWYEKRGWTIEQWEAYACADDLRTFIGYIEGSIAGYFELKKSGVDTELAYFGLSPAFVGRGYGGGFLSQAINTAWDWPNTHRVIVNTCTLDHPSALGNYKKRGFSVVDEKLVTYED